MRKPIAAVCFALLAAQACSSPPPPQRDPLGRTIASNVSEAFIEQRSFHLALLTMFDWDRFFAFKPETSPAKIDAALGFTWAKNYSDQTNTYCLFVFARGKTVTYSLLYPRYQGDCTTLSRAGPYSKNTAVFAVTSMGKTTGGQPFFQLHEAG
jgi:hypothetical protein